MISDWVPFLGYEGVGSPRLFSGLLAAGAGAGFVAGLWALRSGEGRPGTRRVLLAGAAVLGLYLPKAAVFRVAFGFTVWGLLNVLWYDLSLVLPALSAVALAVPSLRPRRGAARALALLPLLWTPLALWARFVEPRRLVTEDIRVAAPASTVGRAEIRVAVLADLQAEAVTRHEREAVDRVLALRPDLVLLPGDLFQGCERRFREVGPELGRLLARLDAPGGVFFVTGDVDAPRWAGPLLAGTRIRRIDDEIVRLRVRDRDVTLVGLAGDARRPAARRLLASLAEDDGSDLRILLVHRPRAVLYLPDGVRIDLVVAGHTHGGQVVLPFFGPPITLSPLPREVAAGGLHRVEGRWLYVSRGVGLERKQAPRIRFLCPPEVTLLRIGGAESATE